MVFPILSFLIIFASWEFSHVPSHPLLHSKGLHQSIRFFFLPQYCQSSLQSSVQIHTQPKLFSNQIQHFIQKLKANVVKNKKKIQRFFDNGFPHKPKFPFNELFLNVSNCFPCGIYLFDKYFPCGIKPMRLLWETLNHSRKVSFASCGRICPKSLFWERSNDSNIVRFPKDGGIYLSRY